MQAHHGWLHASRRRSWRASSSARCCAGHRCACRIKSLEHCDMYKAAGYASLKYGRGYIRHCPTTCVQDTLPFFPVFQSQPLDHAAMHNTCFAGQAACSCVTTALVRYLWAAAQASGVPPSAAGSCESAGVCGKRSSCDETAGRLPELCRNRKAQAHQAGKRQTEGRVGCRRIFRKKGCAPACLTPCRFEQR